MKFGLAAVAFVACAASAQATFNPIDFFRGRTHGDGTLKIIFQSPQHIQVDNLGTAEKDGTLLLQQVIHQPGKPTRTRYWRMRQTGPQTFEGTLTDAASAVRVEVAKAGIRIRYTGKDHLNFDQLLTPVGASEVHNHMRVRRFGIIVAHFDEVIRKVD